MYFPCSSAPLSQSPCPVSGSASSVPRHGMYVRRHGMYVPRAGTWVPPSGSRRRPRRVFFSCPLCAVCQPFAFSRKNILKKSAKKFGPYGEVVVPLHPISGKNPVIERDLWKLYMEQRQKYRKSETVIGVLFRGAW